MKKILSTFIVFLFLSAAFLPHICISKDISKNNYNNNYEETNYYAVIAGCCKYNNSNYTLPIAPLHNNKTTDTLYASLISGENWEKENIILLFDKNASKENITNALLYMSEIVKENDVFLFSFRGHGSEVDDDNDDERDGTDEIICPYDFDNKTYLTDDELNFYFSKIKSEKMVLIFECCLSGGLAGGDSDIDKEGRLLVLSTFENSLGRASQFFGFPCHFFISELLNANNNYTFLDENEDGYLSIHEIIKFAKLGVLGDKTINFLIFYLAFKIRFRNREFRKLILFIIFYQVSIKLITGHYVFNYLHTVDNIGEELPLVKFSSPT